MAEGQLHEVIDPAHPESPEVRAGGEDWVEGGNEVITMQRIETPLHHIVLDRPPFTVSDAARALLDKIVEILESCFDGHLSDRDASKGRVQVDLDKGLTPTATQLLVELSQRLDELSGW